MARARSCAFVGIDWSGAKGARHRGIAVARMRAGEAPALVQAGHVWSRSEVAEWLVGQAAQEPTLFGFDFSFAPPFVERGAYFPGDAGVPETARALWAYVDACCADEPDLGAAPLVDRHRRHFYCGAADGRKADYLFWRATDRALLQQGGGKSASAYDAIGAAQVARASYAGIRLLHRVGGQVPVWPMDAVPPTGSLIVEIYTRLAIRRAGLPGRKLRDRASLAAALAALGAPAGRLPRTPTDHEADALVTAAALARWADEPALWSPAALTPRIAATEGWTFGVA